MALMGFNCSSQLLILWAPHSSTLNYPHSIFKVASCCINDYQLSIMFHRQLPQPVCLQAQPRQKVFVGLWPLVVFGVGIVVLLLVPCEAWGSGTWPPCSWHAGLAWGPTNGSRSANWWRHRNLMLFNRLHPLSLFEKTLNLSNRRVWRKTSEESWETRWSQLQNELGPARKQ